MNGGRADSRGSMTTWPPLVTFPGWADRLLPMKESPGGSLGTAAPAPYLVWPRQSRGDTCAGVYTAGTPPASSACSTSPACRCRCGSVPECRLGFPLGLEGREDSPGSFPPEPTLPTTMSSQSAQRAVLHGGQGTCQITCRTSPLPGPTHWSCSGSHSSSTGKPGSRARCTCCPRRGHTWYLKSCCSRIVNGGLRKQRPEVSVGWVFCQAPPTVPQTPEFCHLAGKELCWSCNSFIRSPTSCTCRLPLHL